MRPSGGPLAQTRTMRLSVAHWTGLDVLSQVYGKSKRKILEDLITGAVRGMPHDHGLRSAYKRDRILTEREAEAIEAIRASEDGGEPEAAE